MRIDNRDYRADEQEMAVFLERELEAKDPRTFTELYASLRARSFIPKIPGIDATDREYSYDVWSTTGEARHIGEGARDLPVIEVGRRPVSVPLQPIGASMKFWKPTLLAAARKGIPLEDMTVRATAVATMRKIDRLLAVGDAALGVTGLANDATILANNSVANVGNFATAANKLDSLNKLVSTTRARLEQAALLNDETPAFGRFVVLLPPTEYAACKNTPASANYPQSILQVFLDNNREWVEAVDEWSVLQTIHAGGKPRGICYPRDPMALGAPIAEQEFLREPPQFEGLNVKVPVWTNAGPCVIRYGVAFSYMLLSA